MRRVTKKITDATVIADLLNSAPVGRLATVGQGGWPMVKPLNFAYYEGRIYFHCAQEGEKLDDIRRDSRVCFEVDLPIAYVQASPDSSCQATYYYRSVIIRGRAVIVEKREERLSAFDALMRKYQPDGGYGPFLEEKLALTCIVRVEVEDLSGKEDLGKGELREKTLQALSEKRPLPFVVTKV